jgi:N-carbamoyl-L-amino-acid hydrolase
VKFDQALHDRITTALGGAPTLPTGAGHDAGILSALVPSAMLFVRNPTGVSHSPAEHADTSDCLAGIAALTTVLEDLACR